MIAMQIKALELDVTSLASDENELSTKFVPPEIKATSQLSLKSASNCAVLRTTKVKSTDFRSDIALTKSQHFER